MNCREIGVERCHCMTNIIFTLYNAHFLLEKNAHQKALTIFIGTTSNVTLKKEIQHTG